MKPLMIDLFCCAGGASKGYADVGFEVVGVDIEPQPHYPFKFIQADAMTFDLHGFDAVAASPPCQRYSNAQRIRDNEHPDLIPALRDKLKASGLPYAIENVVGAPLINPVLICGSMFSLGVYRHRLFETNFRVEQPMHRPHEDPIRKMGRPPKPGEMMHVVGNFSGVKQARKAMEIDWMPRDKLREAIPPAYTEYVGRAMMKHLAVSIAA